MGLFKKGAPRTPTRRDSLGESSSAGGGGSNNSTESTRRQSVSLHIHELLVDNIERVDVQESGERPRRKRNIDISDRNGFILEICSPNSKSAKEYVESKELTSDGKIIFSDSISVDSSKYDSNNSKSKTVTVYLRAHVSHGSSGRKKIEKIAKGHWDLEEILRDVQDIGRNGKEMQQTVELNFAKNVEDLMRLKNQSGNLSLHFRAVISCRDEPASPDSEGPGTPVLRGISIAEGLMSRRNTDKQQTDKERNELLGKSETEQPKTEADKRIEEESQNDHKDEAKENEPSKSAAYEGENERRETEGIERTQSSSNSEIDLTEIDIPEDPPHIFSVSSGSTTNLNEESHLSSETPKASSGPDNSDANMAVATMHSDLFVPASENQRNVELERELRTKIKQLQQALSDADDRLVAERRRSDRLACESSGDIVKDSEKTLITTKEIENVEEESPDLDQKILELEYEIRDLKKSLLDSENEVVVFKEKFKESEANNEVALTRCEDLEAKVHLMDANISRNQRKVEPLQLELASKKADISQLHRRNEELELLLSRSQSVVVEALTSARRADEAAKSALEAARKINAAPTETVQDSELNFDAVDEYLLSPSSLFSPDTTQASRESHFQNLENFLDIVRTPRKQAATASVADDLKASQKDLANQVSNSIHMFKRLIDRMGELAEEDEDLLGETAVISKRLLGSFQFASKSISSAVLQLSHTEMEDDLK